jgi:prepilin-type N-terminal cleavage/methylation domain-containing protein
MKMKFTTSWPPSARPGLTLVEVLAALVLLGTILTGLVMAKSHHTRQLTRTAERQTGIRLADELITRWWTSPQGIPVDQRGAIDGDSSWVWDTRLVPNDALQTLGTRVVRVTVRPVSNDFGTATDDQAAVSVDLVLPDPDLIRTQNRAIETRDKDALRKVPVVEQE